MTHVQVYMLIQFLFGCVFWWLLTEAWGSYNRAKRVTCFILASVVVLADLALVIGRFGYGL